MGLLMLKNVEAALGGSRGRRHPVPGPHPHFPGAKCKVSYMYPKRSTCTGPSWQEPREELGKSEGRQAEQKQAGSPNHSSSLSSLRPLLMVQR